jgi:ribosomal protein S21
MVLEVKKQERETTQALIRRFSKNIHRSGILMQARKNRFHKRTKSDPMKKEAALRRETAKIRYEKLKKLGQLKKNVSKRRS